MNIRVFRVDLRETNQLLERNAVAMERIAAVLEKLVEVPAQEPAPPRKKITPADIGSYGEQNETEEGFVARLRKAGMSDIQIEKAVMNAAFGQDEQDGPG